MLQKATRLLFFILLLSIIFQCDSKKSKYNKKSGMVQKGNIVSQGEIATPKIEVTRLKNLFALSAYIKKLLTTSIVTKSVISKVLSTPLIIPNNKINTIRINSYIQVEGEVKFEPVKCITNKKKLKKNLKKKGSSFMQLKSLKINGKKQFYLGKKVDIKQINKELNKSFINSLLKKNKNSKNQEFIKEIDIGNQFKHLIIETGFSFINMLWSGHTAYIKINEHIYWMDQHNWEDENQNQINLCNDKEILNENWTNPIKIVYRKPNGFNGKLKISFGLKFNNSHKYSKLIISDCKNLKALPKINNIFEFKPLEISFK